MRLPRVTGKTLVQALKRHGFIVHKVEGSHYRLIHRDDPTTRYAIVPLHSKGTIPLGTLNHILKTARMSVEDILKFL